MQPTGRYLGCVWRGRNPLKRPPRESDTRAGGAPRLEKREVINYPARSDIDSSDAGISARQKFRRAFKRRDRSSNTSPILEHHVFQLLEGAQFQDS